MELMIWLTVLFLLSAAIALRVNLRGDMRRAHSRVKPLPNPIREHSPYPNTESFMVRGYSHMTVCRSFVRSDLYRHLEPGQSLRLVREPDNPFDENAILIYPEDGPFMRFDLGYVPRRYALDLAPQLDAGAKFTAEVERLPIYGQRGQFPKLYVAITMTKAPVIGRAA